MKQVFTDYLFKGYVRHISTFVSGAFGYVRGRLHTKYSSEEKNVRPSLLQDMSLFPEGRISEENEHETNRIRQMSVLIKALVADDDQTHREIFADLMMEEGMQVESVDNGDMAVELIQSNDYDLILSDLMMPGKDGIEVLRVSHEKNEETLVVIITGFGTLETAIEAIRLGAHDYVTKPFKLEELQLVFKNAKDKILLVRTNRELQRQLNELGLEMDVLRTEREELAVQLEETRARLNGYEHNLSALIHRFPFLLNPSTPIKIRESDREEGTDFDLRDKRAEGTRILTKV